MISIQVRKPYLSKVDKHAITAIVNQVIAEVVPLEQVDMGILICSDAEIWSLNSKYRQIDRPTDVLSFSAEESDPFTGHRHLGDIVVSYETALAQAIEMHQDVETEIIILIIHGLLHLAGYHHDTNKSKKEMWQKQYSLHSTVGIEVDSLPGEND